MVLIIFVFTFAVSFQSISCFYVLPNADGSVELQAVYTEVKPFIYFDPESDRMEGIYPLIFYKSAAYCTDSPRVHLVNYTVQMETSGQMDELMKSDTNIGEGGLGNITKETIMWLPFDTHVDKIGPRSFLKRNLTKLNLLSSNGLAVFMPRKMIALPNKLLRGTRFCDLIVIITILVGFLFGLLVWIVERPYNPAFQDRIGPLSGIYWSFVTMTTVGYGDIVPVSIIGKTISVVWMFMGLMVAAVMTATLTNVVTGVEGLGIEGKRVAVMRDSYEELYVERDYRAVAVTFDTYEEVIQASRDEVVYASVLPYDVAAWMQDEIRHPPDDVIPLSAVYILQGKVPFDILVYLNKTMEHLFYCMLEVFPEEIVRSSEELYKRPIILETTFYGNVFETFLYNVPVQIIAGITLLVILVSVVVYIFARQSKVNVKEQKKITIERSINQLAFLLDDYKQILKTEELSMKPFS
ncbi:uncharacterized protein [Clytia hemisphaerica]|uniref:uncharacterized protein n=1 Tax=Clytia hemisphaerica TaxID=252671 RepID=UPI0034D41EC4